MNNFIVIFLSGFVSLFFWSGGYVVKGHLRELILPKWVKFLYGKPNQSIYANGTVLQTFGYIQSLYTLQMVLYLFGYEYIFPPKLLLFIFTLITSIPVLTDTIIRELFKKR